MKTMNSIICLAVIMATGAFTKTSSAECLHSRWLIENRITDSKLPVSDCRITFTFHHYEFDLGMQTVWITYGKTKKQVKSNVKGMYALALKPGKYKIVLQQDKCDPLTQNIEIKSRERLSIKVTFEKALDPNIKCALPVPQTNGMMLVPLKDNLARNTICIKPEEQSVLES